jgi:hypothetical protein
MSGFIEYAADLYEEATVQAISLQAVRLLEAMPANLETRIAEIPVA